MVGNASKRNFRIENKKKKMAALLDIVKLNEYDRARKLKKANKEAQERDIAQAETEPSAKRLKILNDTNETNGEDFDQSPPLIKVGPSGKPLLEGEEYIKVKIRLREMTRKRRQSPYFRLRELGLSASLNVNINDRVPMFLSDLQHLIMYSQIGIHSPYSPARWCALDKYNKIENMNLLIIENVSIFHYVSQESQMPFISSQFEHKLEMITPASYHSDIVKDLSMVPLTDRKKKNYLYNGYLDFIGSYFYTKNCPWEGTQMRKLQNKFGSLESAVLLSNEIFDTVKNFFPIEDDNTVSAQAALPPGDKFSRTQLLLSGWQMVEENFPLPIQGLLDRKYSGYVLTKDKYQHVTPFSPIFALDCEMCKTSSGDLELTRITAVDENHKVFYETLVKPDNQITDYLTKYSGINKKMMKDVKKKLKDVQEDLSKLLPEDAILVGQSLANDLHALRMMHPYIIDTSVIYNLTGDRTRKTKLQVLAREFLQEKIQMSQKGHCSHEDSLACMKLVQLKLKNSLYFGDAVMNNISKDLRNYSDIGTSQYATNMLRQCIKIDKTANVVSTEEISKRYKFYLDKGNDSEVKNILCNSENSNEDVIKKYISSLKSFSLNIAHIKVAKSDIVENTCTTLQALDKWVQDVYDATVSPGLIAVVIGGYKKSNGVCFLHMKHVKGD